MVGIPFSRWLTAVELRIIRNLRYTDINLHYLPPCNAEDANALSPEYSPSVSVDAVVKAGRFASVGNAATLSPISALSLVQSSSPLSNWPKMIGKSRLSVLHHNVSNF